MRPPTLGTRIFLDSGDPGETAEVIRLLGFLDGQTTNPTLISKNPESRRRLEQGKKFSKKEILDFYRQEVEKISTLIPQGSVSIEVYADHATTADEMLGQGREMFSWIPNGHIKFPSTREGLKAAEKAVREKIRVNMTLCFTQEQAAAVYAVTRGAKKGDVFVSPFVGRLDDRGENGMDLISHIIEMYRKGDGHVEVLTASVRTLDHFLEGLKLGSDIASVPFNILKEWSGKGLSLPGDHYVYQPGNLKKIPFGEIPLIKNREEYDLRHELTDKGMERFSADWNALIQG
jgi:transaldolase